MRYISSIHGSVPELTVQSHLTDAIPVINRGGVAVISTDTVYGLVAQALNPTAVDRVRALKERPQGRSFIVLISSLKDLELFSISLTSRQEAFLEHLWPRAVSVGLPVTDASMDYLAEHETIAFRVPESDELRDFLQKTGPLVAPSANLTGKPTATTISEAKAYFKNQVDIYIDKGVITDQASTLVDLTTEPWIRREGVVTTEEIERIWKNLA